MASALTDHPFAPAETPAFASLLLGLVLALLPLASAAQCLVVTDDPIDGCIGEVRVDSPNMSVTGQSVTAAPGAEVQFTATAFTGVSTEGAAQPTGCQNGWEFAAYDPMGNPVQGVTSGNSFTIPAQNNRGIGRVDAKCLDNPSIANETTVVTGTGLAAPAAPVLMTPGPTESAAAGAAPAAGGSGAGTALLVGAVVAGGVAIAAAVASATETTTDTGTSGGWYADWKCTSSQCASVMGGYSGSAGPFATKSECIAWTQTYIQAPCNYR